MVLVRSDLDFNLISINSDDEGRSIVMVQGSPLLFVNIYASSKTQDQCCFFDKLNDNIEDCVANKELKIILEGNFNVTLDSDLDCSGGRPFSNGRSNPEVVGSIPTEVKRFFLYLVWFPDSLY